MYAYIMMVRPASIENAFRPRFEGRMILFGEGCEENAPL
jgi:hypothetical protein